MDCFMPIDWSKLRYKGVPLVIVVILGIAVAALKIRDILTYFSVPFILYMVCRPVSRSTAYKTLFALVAVLTVKGVILLVRGVILLVSIK